MSHSLYLTLIVTLAGAFVLVCDLLENRRMRQFLSRGNALADWQQHFPTATPEEVERFLSLFAEAFCFSAKQASYFHPTDRIMDIYRARYSRYSIADVMELETFFCAVENEYDIDLTAHWHDDITLGEIFEMTQRVATDRLRTA